MAKPRGPSIVFGGPPGSGKTTYARRLAEDLGLDYYSAGMIFRELASQYGVSLEELNRIAEEDPRIDLAIDRKAYELALRGGVVLEGHLLPWIVRDVVDVAIYVKAPLEVRVKRIASRDSKHIQLVLHETLGREASHYTRFRRYYGIDVTDLSIFDLVIDTSILGVDEVYETVKTFVCRLLAKLGYKLNC